MTKKKIWYHGWVVVENPRVIRYKKSVYPHKEFKDDAEPYAKADIFYFNDIRCFFTDGIDFEKGHIIFKDKKKQMIEFTKILKINLEDVGCLTDVFNKQMNNSDYGKRLNKTAHITDGENTYEPS